MSHFVKMTLQELKKCGLKFVHVGPRHPLCAEDAYKEPHLDMPPSAVKLLRTCGAADGAILAVYNGDVIGFFRYFRDETVEDQDLGASGTWVDPWFRRRGLGKAMWEAALKRTGAKTVGVVTISATGKRLVKSLKDKHPGVGFGKLRR